MKKIFFVVFFILSTFSFLKAQNNKSDNDKEIGCVFPELMVEYPGGDEARILFIQKNLIYPDSANKNKIEAKVQIQFVVCEDGKISDITALTHKGWGFEEEAIRVIKLMPPWKPGKQLGSPVAVRISIPIIFKLNKDGK